MTGPDKGYSALAALALGRAMQRVYQGEPLARQGQALEEQASAALKAGESELPRPPDRPRAN